VSERPGAPLRHLHPLSPLVRGWKIFAGLAAVVAQQVAFERHGGALVALVVLGAAVPVAGVLAWLSWRTTRFGIESGDLRIDSGVLVRRSRRIRLDRLQAVDVVRPLLARVAGLAELRLEVVGGGKHSEGALAYLGEDEARALRAELLARAAGLIDADPRQDVTVPEQSSAPPPPEADEHLLHEVPWGRYLGSLALSGSAVVSVVAVAVVVALAATTRSPGLLLAIAPSLLVPAHLVFVRGQNDALFTLSGSADGLRIRHGLLETRQQTVPPGRVQALRVEQPLLWRRQGWVRVSVTVAGYGHEGALLTGTLLPVAPEPEALGLVRLVLGAEVGPHPGAQSVPLRPAPRQARWLDPLAWRRLGVGADDRVLVVREGVLHRRTSVVPHAKVQSVAVRQGWLQRRLRLATLAVHVPPALEVPARHREVAEAVTLLVEETDAARAARARAVRERWSEPVDTGARDSGARDSGARDSGARESGAEESAVRPVDARTVT
jgi:putative membrane protein